MKVVASQINLVSDHLKHKGELNPKQAYEKYGVYRLAAVIGLLRGKGIDIETRMVYYTKPSGRPGRYAVYSLKL
jgi:hypothetical protein